MSDIVQQLSDQTFLTDSGLETDLIFHRGIDLPGFAAFPLLDDSAGLPMLAQYYRDHAAVAAAYDVGFVYETPTWRASADWGAQLGFDAAALRAVNSRAIELMAQLRAEAGGASVISGCIGPRGDGYRPQSVMTARESISVTDDATDAGAAYFMINCAHPSHIEHALPEGADWTSRVRGILANASRRSHAELDEAADLDDGDPVEFGSDYQRLRALAPTVTILGGCCGTDVRHVRAIAAACLPNPRPS